MQIGFLTCPGTHPGSERRREDAFEHDMQVDALRPALESLGHELVEIDWRSPVSQFGGLPLILVGTPWDYHDDEARFLAQLDALEATGHIVCNSAETVRWNARKTYLRTLEKAGIATIPTIWLDSADTNDIASAMERFGTETIVAKRQVGAGAEGQSIHHRGALDSAWMAPQPMMLQPFIDSIARDGEYSFLFVDGEFSHALVKRPAAGDYRVQSLYGGTEEVLSATERDLATAKAVVDAIPFDTPLYARIDMVRGPDGRLLVIEAELIEPFLYPAQGPELGRMMAGAIDRRLGT